MSGLLTVTRAEVSLTMFVLNVVLGTVTGQCRADVPVIVTRGRP